MAEGSALPGYEIGRPVGRREFLQSVLVGGVGLYLVGCGSSDDGDDLAASPSPTAGDETPVPTANSAGEIRPVLLAQEYVVAEESRFLVGLLDGENEFVRDAKVDLRFFRIGADGTTGTLAFEQAAQSMELDVEGEDRIPFHIAAVTFEGAGPWGVEIASTPPGGSVSKVQVPFEVQDAPKTPAIGASPPASQNDTIATNPNTESLCSRDPICGLHDKVIADVLASGRRLVVQFSTPAYCATRFCGPVLEVLLAQVPAYQDRIDFVHIEVYQDFQLQQYRQAITEWGLPGEPYTFFVGADGTVRGRLEAIFTTAELQERLESLL